MDLGRKIQELRRGQGLSQERLAEQMAVSRQAISKWESGGAIPEVDKLIQLAQLFGATVDDLLGIAPRPEPQGAPMEGEGPPEPPEENGETQPPPSLEERLRALEGMVSALMAERQQGRQQKKWTMYLPLAVTIPALVLTVCLSAYHAGRIQWQLRNLQVDLSRLNNEVINLKYKDTPLRDPAPETEQPSKPDPKPDPEPEPAPEPEPEPDPQPEEEPEEPENSGKWQDLRVSSGGSTVSDSAVSIVAQIVQNEIGSGYPEEALKAQAVAAYTFVRYHNLTGSVPAVGLRSPADKVTRIVKEVAGEEITYDGRPILASYGAMNAGQSASSRSVWGTALPYLTPVESEGDPGESGFQQTKTIPASEVKSKLEKAFSISLDGMGEDEWFDILSYWDDGPYVNEVRIAHAVTTTGRKLRESVFSLRSTAFEVRYDPGAESFDFITQGYGHGVGMSQVGAKYYANQGWDHVEILEHYYPGATVSGQ